MENKGIKETRTFKIKFFGSKTKKEQLTKVKMDIDIDFTIHESIEEKLKKHFGYVNINGLKISKEITI